MRCKVICYGLQWVIYLYAINYYFIDKFLISLPVENKSGNIYSTGVHIFSECSLCGYVYLFQFEICLLQTQIYCGKANHTTIYTTWMRDYLVLIYKNVPNKTCTPYSDLYFIWCTNSVCNELFLRSSKSWIRAWCKVGIVFNWNGLSKVSLQTAPRTVTKLNKNVFDIYEYETWTQPFDSVFILCSFM
jgi:hypothetical protein